MSDDEKSILEPEISPLTEAEAGSINTLIGERINKLFNTRPQDITDEDLTAMIEYYRKERGRFIIESQNKAPRAKPGTAAAKKPAPTSVADAMQSMNAIGDLF
jgi:hypothetical protein